MRLPNLGSRLRIAIDLAGNTARFADIGADHGLLSAAILQQNPNAYALLTDISPKALQKAHKLLERAELDDRAEFFIGDGFSVLKGEDFDTAFILGMGGDTVAGILQRGEASLAGSALVLSGHTHIPLLRETVYRIGYHIADEAVACEKNRFYFLLRCEPGYRPIPNAQALFIGQALARKKPPEWIAYLQKQRCRYKEIVTAMQAAAQEKDRVPCKLAAERLEWIETVLDNASKQTEEVFL